MRVLLHACCGPCALAPLDKLRSAGHEVEGLWYNPNIHPYSEYQRRLMTAGHVFGIRSARLHIQPPDFEVFLDRLTAAQREGKRCRSCWRWRLEMAAAVARREGFAAFSTTLLVSPHQENEAIREIGRAAAEKLGIVFLAEDFRPLYPAARKESRSLGLYHQNYCGCLYSEWERFSAVEPGRKS
ncbi:MAG TPA: epoxyqueuosine reductase QueH [bacterium]|uniref:Epoxyqueuosine reductase QueH n=1 Tax=candidate division TA06 bacterium ADurb.Bin417 TaxID=1852828 RepID=A0A1V5MI45_UNCT6|nr:MAG: hypothetical protein BWY73_00734 [candidate division TA06 bacterium ADurb.Bin417]HNQ35869.1 epoxyqueuosine reductase QueH [bacterium]HNS47994.1 epoxyqueuosine reductase QueH [bacterium]